MVVAGTGSGTGGVLKSGLTRIGNCEIAPFGGSSASVMPSMRSTRSSPSAGMTLAAGIVPAPAVGLVVAEMKTTATAPAAAALLATSANGVAGSVGLVSLTSAMRPRASGGQSARVWPLRTKT